MSLPLMYWCIHEYCIDSMSYYLWEQLCLWWNHFNLIITLSNLFVINLNYWYRNCNYNFRFYFLLNASNLYVLEFSIITMLLIHKIGLIIYAFLIVLVPLIAFFNFYGGFFLFMEILIPFKNKEIQHLYNENSCVNYYLGLQLLDLQFNVLFIHHWVFHISNVCNISSYSLHWFYLPQAF
jgi:hypothetical protein